MARSKMTKATGTDSTEEKALKATLFYKDKNVTVTWDKEVKTIGEGVQWAAKNLCCPWHTLTIHDGARVIFSQEFPRVSS